MDSSIKCILKARVFALEFQPNLPYRTITLFRNDDISASAIGVSIVFVIYLILRIYRNKPDAAKASKVVKPSELAVELESHFPDRPVALLANQDVGVAL